MSATATTAAAARLHGRAIDELRSIEAAPRVPGAHHRSMPSVVLDVAATGVCGGGSARWCESHGVFGFPFFALLEKNSPHAPRARPLPSLCF